MQRSTMVSMCLLAFVLGGCASHSGTKAPKQPKHPVRIALLAVGNNRVGGVLDVTPVSDGVRIRGLVSGMAPNSTHAFHLHERGDCTSPNSGSPGRHFNPTGVEHGDPVGLVHHAGDMSNQLADAQGDITLDVTVHGVSLGTGLNDDVTGRSLVVQAGPDDYGTQPDGNAGAAIACGVILKK